MRPGLLAASVLAATVLACSSSNSGTDLAAPSETTAGGGVKQAPKTLPVSAPGSGSIAVGATVSTFTVSECSADGEPADAAGNKVVFGLRGKGTTSSGIAFTVSVRRIETPGDQQTYSDEVYYQDTARIYQAQRVESGGIVTDVRDPKADLPLLAIGEGHVTAKGKMSSPGDDGTDAEGHDFTVPLLLDATCA